MFQGRIGGMSELIATNASTPARRLKRTQLAVLSVMNGLGWDQMDNATRAAAIAMKIEDSREFINDSGNSK